MIDCHSVCQRLWRKNVSVSLVTDAESAVSALVSEAGGGFHFSVKRAGPQNHETVGHAERTIRWIKESVRTLMLEFQKQGLTLTFERVFVQRLLPYVCFSHNNSIWFRGQTKLQEKLQLGPRFPRMVLRFSGLRS